ncbi:hypothetical protein SAMN02927916_3244 [Flavobacterium anhuiense]|uniref:Uncharacterized protein n=1 Tax=Flavobacterium anhuiense TaxID=459526 RepID=A0ABY0LXE8_9FLAO|nr:hypothetical protein SAMN02927916_3244 [Flavobacterium anhuiense]
MFYEHLNSFCKFYFGFFAPLFADAEINFLFFTGYSKCSGTIMVHFKAKYLKLKQSILIEFKITHGSCLCKNSRNSEYYLHIRDIKKIK